MPVKTPFLMLIGLALAAFALATGGAAADEVWLGPSFACSKAQTPIEKAICSDTELAALDLAMADLYKQVLNANPDGADAIKGAQRLTMTARNACTGSGSALKACVAKAYTDRIALLMHQSGTVGPLPKPGIYVPIWQPMSSGLEIKWVDEATVSAEATAIMGAKKGCKAAGNIAGSKATGGFGFLGSKGRVDTEMPTLRVVGTMLIVSEGMGYCTSGSTWPPVWVRAD